MFDGELREGESPDEPAYSKSSKFPIYFIIDGAA